MSHEGASWIDRQRVQPFILAGGLSSRFGQDKSRVSIDGQKQIDRLIAAMQSDLQCRPIVIVRDESGAVPEGESTLRDSMPSQGPICGLATGLNHLCQDERKTGRDWGLFVPCDQLNWSSRITNMLLGEPSEHGDIRVVAFESQSYIQPFPSLWHASTAEVVTKAAMSEERSIAKLIRNIDSSLIRTLTNEQDIASFNTREELDSLLKLRHGKSIS